MLHDHAMNHPNDATIQRGPAQASKGAPGVPSSGGRKSGSCPHTGYPPFSDVLPSTGKPRFQTVLTDSPLSEQACWATCAVDAGQKNSAPVFEGIWLGRVGGSEDCRPSLRSPAEPAEHPVFAGRDDGEQPLRHLRALEVGPDSPDHHSPDVSVHGVDGHPSLHLPQGTPVLNSGRCHPPEYTTPLVTGQKIPHQIFGGLDV